MSSIDPIRALLGPWPDPPALDPEVVSVEDCGTYRRETVQYTAAGLERITAFLNVPTDTTTGRVRPSTDVGTAHIGRRSSPYRFEFRYFPLIAQVIDVAVRSIAGIFIVGDVGGSIRNFRRAYRDT